MRFDLDSEPFGPHGNLSARGFGNQLGRPDLDILSVLLREAVQNSSDARIGDQPVRFGISKWQLTAAQRQAFRHAFHAMPEDGGALGALVNSREPVHLLALSDRGTIGLNGPTAADQVSVDGSSHFVDFLRNAGRMPERVGAGGTYGYGKAAFYSCSEVGLILAHTHFASSGGIGRRLMGAAWGPEYIAGHGRTRRRFTGRHWWGVRSDQAGFVDPLTGTDADGAATSLGLPLFAQGETGTTVVVVQPALPELPAAEVVSSLERSILCFFWPKMLSRLGDERIVFSVSWDGVDRAISGPEDYPPFAGYVAALETLDACALKGVFDAPGVSRIECGRPRKLLGHVALARFPIVARPLTVDDPPIAMPSHHVALMRRPRLVVSYRPGPRLPSDLIEYGGVFLPVSDDEVEKAFADAEPPTHDAWVAKSLRDSRLKTFVGTALRRIDDALEQFAGGEAGPPQGGDNLPLGHLAWSLRGLVPGLDGVGPEETILERGGGGGGGGGGGPRGGDQIPVAVLDVRHDVVGGKAAVILSFKVGVGAHGLRARLTSRTSVRIDGGASTEGSSPVGARAPRTIYWQSPDGSRTSGSDSVVSQVTRDGIWWLAIELTDDTLAGVTIEAEAAGE